MRQLEWGREPAEDVRITLSQLQLQMGFLDPLPSCTRLPALHIEPDWLSCIRQRLCDLNAHIEIEDAWTPLSQRVHDQSLMEIFCRMRQQKGMSDSKLRQVNRVRIWLRVITYNC